jgi:hypothetical protein
VYTCKLKAQPDTNNDKTSIDSSRYYFQHNIICTENAYCFDEASAAQQFSREQKFEKPSICKKW